MYNVIYINQISFTLNAKQIFYPLPSRQPRPQLRIESEKLQDRVTLREVNEFDARSASVRNRAIESVLVMEIKVTKALYTQQSIK